MTLHTADVVRTPLYPRSRSRSRSQTRFVVQAGQVALTPFLAGLYVVRPQLLHRFVGYLEETAVHTYTNIVQQTLTPGTKLHEAWKDTPAPVEAIDYWKMPRDAMWVDALKRMLADESHHRDVNHAMASMTEEQMFGQDSPFVHEHIADYEAGVKRHTEAVLKKALSEVMAANTVHSSDILAPPTERSPPTGEQMPPASEQA